MNPRDETHRRRSESRYFWIALCLLIAWAGAAYLLAPLIWKLYFRHHPSLANVDRITHTADGHPGDPLNIAMLATEEELVRAMVAIGWYPANPITFESSLRIVVDSVLQRPDDHAPVSSLSLFGRKQDLAFEQPVGNSPRQRHHVRFWRSAQREDGRPLWFGAATFDRSVGLSHTTGEVTHHIGPDVDAERDRLAKQLASRNWVKRSIGRIVFINSSKAATAAAIHGIPMESYWSSCSRTLTPTLSGTTKRNCDEKMPPHPFSPMPRIEAVKKTHLQVIQTMRAQTPVVFLVDVDNTLINNDRIKRTSKATSSENLAVSIEIAFGRSRKDSLKS